MIRVINRLPNSDCSPMESIAFLKERRAAKRLLSPHAFPSDRFGQRTQYPKSARLIITTLEILSLNGATPRAISRVANVFTRRISRRWAEVECLHSSHHHPLSPPPTLGISCPRGCEIFASRRGGCNSVKLRG